MVPVNFACTLPVLVYAYKPPESHDSISVAHVPMNLLLQHYPSYKCLLVINKAIFMSSQCIPLPLFRPCLHIMMTAMRAYSQQRRTQRFPQCALYIRPLIVSLLFPSVHLCMRLHFMLPCSPNFPSARHLVRVPMSSVPWLPWQPRPSSLFP